MKGMNSRHWVLLCGIYHFLNYILSQGLRIKYKIIIIKKRQDLYHFFLHTTQWYCHGFWPCTMIKSWYFFKVLWTCTIVGTVYNLYAILCKRQCDKKISRKWKSSHLYSKCIDVIVNNSSSHIFHCFKFIFEFLIKMLIFQWNNRVLSAGGHLQSFNPLKLQHFLTINPKFIIISVSIQSTTNGLNKALTFLVFTF